MRGRNTPDNEAAPLVDGGFMYVESHSGYLHKIDMTSGNFGTVVWTANAEVAAPVRDERIDLLECGRIEQVVDALSRREAARLALAAKTVFAAAELGAPLQVGQQGNRV